MLDVCLAGTSGMMPLKNRWLSSLWVEYQGMAVLIDCGEGTQLALAHAGLKHCHIDAILITHFHADHISGLPGMLLALTNYGRTEKVQLYGPVGLRGIVNKLRCICAHLSFELEIIELSVKECSSFDVAGLHIETMPLSHSTPCLGYSMSLFRKPVFNPEKAKALEIPLQYWKVLHSGQQVEHDGKIFTTDMVTDGKRKTIKVTYMTDSLYFSQMSDFAYNSDLLVCEGMYGDDESAQKSNDKHHMLFSQAATVAKNSGSKELWLTHYSPSLVCPYEYEDMAKSIFENTVISKDGQKTTIEE